MNKLIKLFSILTAVVGLSLSAVAQTADDIISKHLQAIGGIENWKKINTMKLTGSVNAGGTQIPVTITTVHNKAQKIEFTVNGMTGYTIVTKTAGWSYSPMGGQTKAEAMTSEMVKQMQEQLDVQGELVDYKAKGYKVSYLGKDDVEGTDCYKLKLVFPSGKEETMFFDASNYYNIRTVTKMTANGKEVEQTSNYGDFRKQPEGIVFPMNIDDGEGPVAITSVEINKPVDESIFTPKS